MGRKQEQKETGLVRMLGYALGVAPAELGLVPDAEGWVPVKELVKALHEEEGWRGVRESMVRDAAQRLAPEELELAEGRIRSRTHVPPRPRPGAEPPPHLYVGLRRRAWPALKDRGLAENQAGPVVLAAEEAAALRLGRRRDPEPVLVTVQAHQAMDQGAVFWDHGHGLFTAEWVPARCLMGPPVDEKTQPKRPPKAKKKPPEPSLPPPEAMPGSFLVNAEDVEKPYKRKGIDKRVGWKDEQRKQRRREKKRKGQG
jgi:putative RNA 2'-phosphotransferase